MLFLGLAERLLDGYAVPFAVTAFAIGAPFIRYAAETKSYGIDIAAMGSTLLAFQLRDPDATVARCVFAGMAGAVVVWFSQPTIFILAGLGAALVLAWLRDRDPKQTRRALLVSVPLWAAASAAATLVSIRRVTPEIRAYMDFFWRLRDGFFPWPLRKPGDALWLWGRILELFADPTVLRYRWPALYGGLTVLGLIVLWRRSRFGALVLLGPFAVACWRPSRSSFLSRRGWPCTCFPS